MVRFKNKISFFLSLVAVFFLQAKPVNSFLLEECEKQFQKYCAGVSNFKDKPGACCIFARYTLTKHREGVLTYEEKKFFESWEKSAIGGHATKCQTIAHLSTKTLEKPLKFFDKRSYQPQLLKATLKEQELCSLGYTVFYHGQNNRFGFYQDFHKEILQEGYHQGIFSVLLPKDFFFIRNPKNLYTIMNCSYDKIEGSNYRKKIMSDTYSWNINSLFSSKGFKDYYNDCLFVNGFLFGGTNRFGCSTWEFVVSNSNEIGYYGPDLFQEFLDKLQLSALFNIFEEQVENIKNEHEMFYTRGRLLQIAVPKSKVDLCSFITPGGANRISMNLMPKLLKPLGYLLSTSKVSQQMKYCLEKDVKGYNYPSLQWGECEVHYCLTMTDDIMLNPSSGVKVFGYDSQMLDFISIRGKTITFKEHLEKRKKLVQDIIFEMKNYPVNKFK
jgi:hypothetical protein